MVVSVVGFGLLAGAMLVPTAALRNEMRPAERNTKFDFYAAGKIPAQYGGRVMPLDAYARQTVKAISNKESIPLEGAPSELKDRVEGKSLSAIQWLMEVASDSRDVEKIRMFRIDAEEVRSEFELPRRKSKLYSLEEIRGEWGRVSEIVDEARTKDGADQSFKERKLLELDRRTREYTVAAAAFQLPSPKVMSEAEFKMFQPGQPSDPSSRAMFAMRELARNMDRLKNMRALQSFHRMPSLPPKRLINLSGLPSPLPSLRKFKSLLGLNLVARVILNVLSRLQVLVK